jgi:hypothetical protein
MTEEQVLPWKPTDWVVAIDPGFTTGFSTWHTGAGFDPNRSGQLPWQDFSSWLWAFLLTLNMAGETCHVQSEMFTISARTIKTAIRYESLYVNGATQFTCRHFGFSHAFSKPDQVMNLFDDKALRALGLYIKGMPHQHDAARHLGIVLLQRGVISSRNWTKPPTELEV